MEPLITRASSINRALDQVGDKWCLLIIQEVFWGINSFNDMRAALGVSRGVLSNRLQWLQSLDCISKHAGNDGGRRSRYHLTRKSIELYDCALTAIAWERRFYRTSGLDELALVHRNCGERFQPLMQCRACAAEVRAADVSFRPGPGATRDHRDKKVRRRSSVPVASVPGARSLYRNLINLVGDRWTANVIALAFHGLLRFDEFHHELPVATNILSDRLKRVVAEGVFEQRPYHQRPPRYEYRLTAKGEALFPWFLALLQWGDRWCDPSGDGRPMLVGHGCGNELHGQVVCSVCNGVLQAHQVAVDFSGRDDNP
jgi:DNA-binding HxlR family transcriptional regulator